MTKIHETGIKGENLAADYLINKGYTILFRNWKYMHRELDIIAKCKNELVIIEVKTRHIGSMISPTEAVTNKKQKLIIDAANIYIQKHNINLDVRFDIISIVYNGNSYQIEHLENAFYPKQK